MRNEKRVLLLLWVGSVALASGVFYLQFFNNSEGPAALEPAVTPDADEGLVMAELELEAEVPPPAPHRAPVAGEESLAGGLSEITEPEPEEASVPWARPAKWESKVPGIPAAPGEARTEDLQQDRRARIMALASRFSEAIPGVLDALRQLDPEAEAALFEEHLALAQAGDVHAAQWVGFQLEHGIGVEKDFEMAAQYYSWAAEQGGVDVMVNLARFHAAGMGVEQDYQKALRLLETAMAHDHPGAAFLMGTAYLDGWAGKKNRDYGVTLIRSAAEAGHQPAIRAMRGLGGKEESMYWLERLAQAGDPDARASLTRATAFTHDIQPERYLSQIAAAAADGSHTAQFETAVESISRKIAAGETSLANEIDLLLSPNAPEGHILLAAHAFQSADPDGYSREGLLSILNHADASWPRTQLAKLLIEQGAHAAEAIEQARVLTANDAYMRVQELKNMGNSSGQAPPRPVDVAPIPYPQGLRLDSISGTVRVLFTVDVHGNVISPEVVSSPHPLLSQAALEGVKQWKFLPAMKDWKPAEQRVSLPLVFTVPGQEQWAPDTPPPPPTEE